MSIKWVKTEPYVPGTYLLKDRVGNISVGSIWADESGEFWVIVPGNQHKLPWDRYIEFGFTRSNMDIEQIAEALR